MDYSSRIILDKSFFFFFFSFSYTHECPCSEIQGDFIHGCCKYCVIFFWHQILILSDGANFYNGFLGVGFNVFEILHFQRFQQTMFWNPISQLHVSIWLSITLILDINTVNINVSRSGLLHHVVLW
jgi:hypothetical protein